MNTSSSYSHQAYSILIAAALCVAPICVAPVRAEEPLGSLAAAIRQDIPEVGFQIRSCEYFFKIKSPKEFKIARPESFGDMSSFKTSDLFYSLNSPLGTVWKQYMTINPLKIWSSNRCTIRAAYVPSQDKVLTRKDMEAGWPGFEVGMKIFVDMASMPVAISNKPAIMVGLQIVRLDEASKTVEFRYLEGTPSYGKQIIEFTSSAANPNTVEISHKTWFRSYGAAIEKLYPMYHRLMINNMHAGFKAQIEGERAP